MGLYLQIDDGEPAMLASNRGWSDFGNWAETLDAETFYPVAHLWEHGYFEGLDILEVSLRAAIETIPPTDVPLRTTVTDLIETLTYRRKDARLAMVTNGMVEDDGVEEVESPAKRAAATRKRRAAGRKAAATRKRKSAGKKAAITRKRRAAGQKAAITRKRRAAARKAVATKKARKASE